jgi:membrane-associated phospholipid phosphatase
MPAHDAANVSPSETPGPAGLPAASRAALVLLAIYLILAGLAIVAPRSGAPTTIVTLHVMTLGTAIVALRTSNRTLAAVGMWLPLISMSLLYSELPYVIAGIGNGYSDALIQRWEMGIFDTQPAATFAGVASSLLVSELLHAAYVSYYAMIYVPPALLWFRGERVGFADTMLALTIGIVTCFSIFAVFPVEGPRYLWPAPDGVSDGPMRWLALRILESGSSRGTAFPSSHVAIATIQCLAALRWQPRLGRVLVPVVVLLAAGAVYGGFHYATDALAGGVLGVTLWFAYRALPSAAPARMLRSTSPRTT